MNIVAKNQTVAASVRGSSIARNLVKKPLMLGIAALALSAVAAPSSAANWWDKVPYHIGRTTINVRNAGALGNGSHDDTAAFQNAINSLPSSGGTVYVPAGHYMINALKPILMRSHTRIKMDDLATLEVIPNSSSRYWAIRIKNVDDVRIVGGNLVGDRARHIGSTGEWGYGINVSGSTNVVLKRINVSNFWGDGIWIGATGKYSRLVRSDYVTVDSVTSSNNRRQGLSIGPAQHVYIVNSTFENTNGTLPEAGIDIEPMDQGPADTIRLENNTFSGNNGNGIEIHYNTSGITVIGNTMIRNRGFGLMGISAPFVTVTGNQATLNGLAGVRASGKSHDWSIYGNALQFNSTRYNSPSSTGGQLNRDLQFGKNTYAIKVWNNVYSNPKYNSFTK